VTAAAEADLTCSDCGYALRGLPDGAACPECGRPVADSVRRRQQWLAWPNRCGLRAGAALWLAAQAVQLVSVVAYLLSGFRRINSPLEQFFIDLRAPRIWPYVWGPGDFTFGRGGWRPLAVWAELVTVILWTVACWRLAARNDGRETSGRPARAVRWLTLASLGIGVASTGWWFGLSPARLWWLLAQLALRRDALNALLGLLIAAYLIRAVRASGDVPLKQLAAVHLLVMLAVTLPAQAFFFFLWPPPPGHVWPDFLVHGLFVAEAVPALSSALLMVRLWRVAGRWPASAA
jgi:hypothetical protein